jgi:hypothetical protein
MRERLFALLPQRSEKGHLVVGCGGNSQLIHPSVRHKHQHEKKGGKTLDVNEQFNPDFVGDITQPNLADKTGETKFNKVRFENVPKSLFGKSEDCDAIVNNLRHISTPKSKVEVKTGQDEQGQELKQFAQALSRGGFNVEKMDAQGGKLKASKK